MVKRESIPKVGKSGGSGEPVKSQNVSRGNPANVIETVTAVRVGVESFAGTAVDGQQTNSDGRSCGRAAFKRTAVEENFEGVR